MAGEFARRLKQFVDAATDDGRGDLRFAFGMLADIFEEIHETLGRRPVVHVEYRSAADAVAIGQSAEQVLKSCQLIEARLLSLCDEPCFHDFDLPDDRDYESLSNFLVHEIVRVAGERAFVYAVWTRGPGGGCLHLGHARGAEAGARWSPARLDASGPLLAALQQGSLVTMILPTPLPSALPYAGASVADLEAAIRVVLGSQRARPVLDDAEPRPPARAASLAEIGRLLDLASRFHLSS